MADPAAYAYRAPMQKEAYVPPQGIRNRVGDGSTEDVFMNKIPDNMDARTSDVVRDMRRLGGARALPDLKERGA